MGAQLENVSAITLWHAPVEVRLSRDLSEKVEGASQALHYLMIRWPTDRGRHYEAACMISANAVQGKGSVEFAREAFIAAAIEARVLA